MATQIANAELQKHLGPEVTIDKTCNNGFWYEYFEPARKRTHRAHLFNVQPIEVKPCEHEPIEWLRGAKDTPSATYELKCIRCGVALKAKWESAT